MNKAFQRNKKKLTLELHSACLNEMMLNEYRRARKSIIESRKLSKKAKKFGVIYDWDNAEFDHDFGWLSVQQLICSPNQEEGFISIFTSLEDIPLDQVAKFEHFFVSGAANKK